MNGHKGSLESLAQAAQIAQVTKATITPISIVEEQYIPSFSLIDSKTYFKSLIKNRKTDVAKWVKKVPTIKKTATPIVQYGDAEHLIVKLAKKHKIDLIVISTHGSSGVTFTLMGKTSSHVLRNASCSVLIMHPSDWKFKLI